MKRRMRDRTDYGVKGFAKTGALVAVLVAACLALAFAAYVFVVRPPFASSLIALVDSNAQEAGRSAGEDGRPASDGGGGQFGDVGDAMPTGAQQSAEQAQWNEAHTYPRVAKLGELRVHSCIAPADLTGVLFHQASHDYAYVLETELPEADYEKTADARTIRVNHDQVSGEWLDADALHIWRTGDQTAMDTSIDIGAEAGTVAHAPVSGTVVLVRDYLLYDEVPDYEIHIQPDVDDTLDCVMIHTDEPVVKAGDRVEGGLTEVCKVRDIEKDLTDVQLSFFTPEGVGGNHIHVQVNDANYPDYRKKRLKGAYKVTR